MDFPREKRWVNDPTNIEYWWPDYSLETTTNDFTFGVWSKREFNELDKSRLPSQIRSKNDVPLKDRLLNHQIIPSRFMNIHTPYNSQLIFHQTGTGKTVTAINIIEGLLESLSTRALIITPNMEIQKVWIEELIKYNPEKYESKKLLTELTKEKGRRTNISKFYEFETMDTFSKKLSVTSSDDWIEKYSNRVIVIDEVHHLRRKTAKLREKEVAGVSSFYQIYNDFLHAVKNPKIILLTATPMIDTSTSEIRRIANLLLSKDEQITIDQLKLPFNKFIDILKQKLNGKISYVKKGFTTVPKIIKSNITKETANILKHLSIYENIVNKGTPQYNAYLKAFKTDKQQIKGGENESDIKSLFGLRKNSIDASNLVFPDGSWGIEGFNKNSTEKNIIINRQKIPIREFNFSTENAFRENLENYSTKYASFITEVEPSSKELEFISSLQINNKEVDIYKPFWSKVWVFNSSVRGSGLVSLSMILKLKGWEPVLPQNIHTIFKFRRKRFILAVKSTTPTMIRTFRTIFNDPRNVGGHYIQLFLGSAAISEGISLKDVRQTHILAPFWNMGMVLQAIGRVFRLDSFVYTNEVIKKLGDKNFITKPKIDVYLHAAVIQDLVKDSIDVVMYQKSEEKDEKIKKIERVLKQLAYDCPINYSSNNKGIDKTLNDTPICDYQKCNYQCSGIPSQFIFKPKDKNWRYTIKNKNINDITWRLYNYNKDKRANGIVNILISEIIDIFGMYFSLTLTILNKLLKRRLSPTRNYWSTTEVVYALEYIITNSIIIVDRWGIFQKLMYNQNNIFLVNLNIDSNSNNQISLLQDFWSENLIFQRQLSFDFKTEEFSIKFDIKQLNKNCGTVDKLKGILPILSSQTQASLLENAISLSLSKGVVSVPTSSKIRMLKDYFKRDIHILSSPTGKRTYVHSLYIEQRRKTDYGYLGTTQATGLLRIFNKEKGMWRYPESEDEEIYYNKKIKDNRLKVLEDLGKKYGYSGMINNKGEFRIVNMQAQNEKEKLAKEKGKQLRGTQRSTGRNCSTWDVSFLLKVLWELKTPYNQIENDKAVTNPKAFTNIFSISKSIGGIKDIIKQNKPSIDANSPKFKKEFEFKWENSKNKEELKNLAIWTTFKSKPQLCILLKRQMKDLGILNIE